MKAAVSRQAQSPAPEALPVFDDVRAAARRLAPHVLRTPVLRSDAFDARTGRRVFFKCENLQHGGAFKFRGAMNALLALPDRAAGLRLVTHSSGNHGAALALAARAIGLTATVVMPEDSSRLKIDAVRRAGADLRFCSAGMPAREAAVAQILGREGGILVHPFDDSQVIAGQGTAALELMTEIPALDVVTVPVGGGGLIAGTLLAVRGMRPHCRVVGVEPERADDAYRSFRTGVRQRAEVADTIADGLRGSIGVRNFALLRRGVNDMVTVSEEEIMQAMRIALEDLQALIEPSSAVPVAALLAGRIGRPGDAVGVVISGGNVDAETCTFLSGAEPA